MTITERRQSRCLVEYVFSGITHVESDGTWLWVVGPPDLPFGFRVSTVAEISLDQDGGAID